MPSVGPRWQLRHRTYTMSLKVFLLCAWIHSPFIERTMPRAWIHLAFAAALLSVPTATTHAQDTPATRAQLRIVDSTKIQLITLRDGSSLVGRIVALRGDTVDF